MAKYPARGNVPAGKVQRAFYLPEELANALRIEAAKRNENQSSIVEKALRRELGMMVEVRSMTEEQLQMEVIGKAWDAQGMLGLDWIDRYPVVDGEGIITDVVAASDGTPDGLTFDEERECYVTN